jgi:predicted O-methyltransferase YrrM
MIKTKIRDFCANLLAKWMTRFAFDPTYFELWERHGFHVEPVGFYSTLPDTRELGEGLFVRESAMAGLDFNPARQMEILQMAKPFVQEFEENAKSQSENTPSGFVFGNTSIESVDAEILHAMVRSFKPRHFVEIGSGFSTKVAAGAMALNHSEGAQAKLTAIEPYPSQFLRNPLAHPIDLIEKKVQEVPLEFFRSLSSSDILFIDSSHVCKIGSDVHYEFLEILPNLASGVVVHVHDIFLPREYPKEWVKDWHRYWNEQYLLQAFLAFNSEFEVLWSGSWMHLKSPDLLESVFKSYSRHTKWPASLWMRRK